MRFFEFMFSSFWIWLGMIIFIYIPIQAIVSVMSRLIRRAMVVKCGWPPEHLDADGDLHKEKTPNKKQLKQI